MICAAAVLWHFGFAAPATAGVDRCRTLLRELNPLHPILSTRYLRHRYGAEGQRIRRGGLISQLAWADFNVDKKVATKFRKAESAGDHQTLLTDDRGRHYLVQRGPATFETIRYGEHGALLADDRAPEPDARQARPAASADLQRQANALAWHLLANRFDAAWVLGRPSFRKNFVKGLTPQLEAALQKGIGFTLRDGGENYQNGAQGTLVETMEGGNKVIEVRVRSPRWAVTVTDELGRQVSLASDRWARLTRGKLPVTHGQSAKAAQLGHAMLAQAVSHAREKEGFKDSLKFFPKVLFYPYAVPYRGLRALFRPDAEFQGQKIRMVRPQVLIRDGVAMLGYLLLLGTATHPALVMIRVADDQDDPSIFLDPYLKQSEAALGPKPEGITLFVDGIPDGNDLEGSPEVLFDRMYGKDPDAVLVHVHGVAELAAAIRAQQAAGKKIARLEIFGHGLTMHDITGKIDPVTIVNLGQDLMTTDPARVAQIRKTNTEIGEAFWRQAHPGEPLPPPPPNQQALHIVSLADFPDLTGAFAPGAQVRLVSCYAGEDAAGTEFLQAFGGKTVGPGGKLVSSTLSIAVPEQEMPADKREALRRQAEENYRRALERLRNIPWYQRAQDSAEEQALLPLESLFLPPYLTYQWLTREDPIKLVALPAR